MSSLFLALSSSLGSAVSLVSLLSGFDFRLALLLDVRWVLAPSIIVPVFLAVRVVGPFSLWSAPPPLSFGCLFPGTFPLFGLGSGSRVPGTSGSGMPVQPSPYPFPFIFVRRLLFPRGRQ